jgi:hypothetical protein
MADQRDGHASEAAQAADAVESVERNTKTQTTAASYSTQDHDVIRAWAEARSGVPAAVDGTGDNPDGDNVGVLRIDFRDDGGSLDDVDWEPFFSTFDKSGLTFVYQENTSDGSVSRFNKFIRQE